MHQFAQSTRVEMLWSGQLVRCKTNLLFEPDRAEGKRLIHPPFWTEGREGRGRWARCYKGSEEWLEKPCNTEHEPAVSVMGDLSPKYTFFS